jgi:DNA-binding response OmpR family regulator
MKSILDSSILYIEDDVITKEQFSFFLKSQCKALYTASNGEEGLALFKRHEPDIIITDIEMPKLDGLTMAKEIRKLSLSAQIIIISAYKKPEYLLEAVNLQLTQYLIKPLSLHKITDALRLTSQYLNAKEIETKKYFDEEQYYDVYTKELVCKNNVIDLSKTERHLLELFLTKHPSPVSYDSIDENVYDYSSTKNAIKLLISSLRQKINKESIINISGFGYKLVFKTKA